MSTTEQSTVQTQKHQEDGKPQGSRPPPRDETVVPVHKDYVGAVIGKKGVTINKIKTNTSTEISHLEEDFSHGHQSHIFKITGSRGNRRKAAKWIRNILQSTWEAEQDDEGASTQAVSADE